MIYSKNGLNLTEQFEGCKLTAYHDAIGVLTIGYGHTTDVYEGQVITQQQAEDFLISDILWAEEVINDNVKINLTQDEFDALVDFVFNIGGTAFFKSTLLKLLNSNQIEAASQEFELLG